MKVKLLIARAHADGAQNRGEIIEVSDAEGARLIEAKQAEPVRRSAPETAVPKRKAEKAAK